MTIQVLVYKIGSCSVVQAGLEHTVILLSQPTKYLTIQNHIYSVWFTCVNQNNFVFTNLYFRQTAQPQETVSSTSVFSWRTTCSLSSAKVLRVGWTSLTHSENRHATPVWLSPGHSTECEEMKSKSASDPLTRNECLSKTGKRTFLFPTGLIPGYTTLEFSEKPLRSEGINQYGRSNH